MFGSRSSGILQTTNFCNLSAHKDTRNSQKYFSISAIRQTSFLSNPSNILGTLNFQIFCALSRRYYTGSSEGPGIISLNAQATNVREYFVNGRHSILLFYDDLQPCRFKGMLPKNLWLDVYLLRVIGSLKI